MTMTMIVLGFFCLFRESHSPFVPHGDELDESKKGDG